MELNIFNYLCNMNLVQHMQWVMGDQRSHFDKSEMIETSHIFIYVYWTYSPELTNKIKEEEICSSL